VVLGCAPSDNLGTDYLWADEGDTAVLASSILKFGCSESMGWRHVTDSDLGARETSSCHGQRAWVQFLRRGRIVFPVWSKHVCARLPFALAGCLRVLLGFRWSGD